MNKTNLIDIKLKPRSYFGRMIFGLRLFIIFFVGYVIYEIYKEAGRISIIDIETWIILGLIMIGLPLLLGFNFYRFYILELKQENNILNVKIMDKDKVFDYQVDLHKTKILLSRLPTRQNIYRLDFYEGEKRIFYQVPLFDWDRDKLKEVYERLKVYYTDK